MPTSLVRADSSAVLRSFFHPVANADESLYRVLATSVIAPTSGEALFTFFTCQRGGAYTKIRIPLSNAASGLTGAFVGVYTFDGTTLTQITINAASAHAAFNAATPGVAVDVTVPSYTLVKGNEYAVGAVFVGTTPPQLKATYEDYSEQRNAPPTQGNLTGQTTLTSPILLSGLGSDFAFRAVFVP